MSNLIRIGDKVTRTSNLDSTLIPELEDKIRQQKLILDITILKQHQLKQKETKTRHKIIILQDYLLKLQEVKKNESK